MMSRRSYMAELSEMSKRRLWPIALSLLLPFLYFVVGEAISFSEALIGKQAYIQEGVWQDHCAYVFEDIFGRTSSFYGITMVLAVMLAIQGFEWLHSRKMLDFYESQPVSRRRRFFQTILHSHLVYLISLLAMSLLGLLIAYGFGIVNEHPIMTYLQFLMTQIFVFFATFHLALLSVMLTGNRLIAVLGTMVFLLYETLLRLMLEVLGSTFLTGWYWNSSYEKVITSPVYYLMLSNRWTYLGTLLLGLITLGASYFLYTRRKNEDAGNAVIFAPARTIIKIALTCFAALTAASVFYTDSLGTVGTIFMMLLFGMIMGCIMEIIYHYDFKALFHEIYSHLVGILLAVVIFMVFVLDVTGYSKWRADPAETSYASIQLSEYWSEYFIDDKDGLAANMDIYTDTYMKLTDIEAVNELMDLAVEFEQENNSSEEGEYFFNLTFAFELTNGKQVLRSLSLPYEVSPGTLDLYDRIFGSQEFKEGYFQVYHDETIRNNTGRFKRFYSNGKEDSEGTTLTDEFYTEFREAYLKDLESFNYSLAIQEEAIGNLNLTTNDGFFITYPVYPSFTESIQFLTDEGIFLEKATSQSDSDSEYYYIDAPFGDYHLYGEW